MALDPISAALNIGGQLIDRLWPDAASRDKAKLALAEMAQKGELAALTASVELAKGQMAVNAAEAASGSLLNSGWRPFLGWSFGAAMVLQFVVAPLGVWAAGVAGYVVPMPPPLDDQVWVVLTGMLGLGSLRTFEKLKGVAKP